MLVSTRDKWTLTSQQDPVSPPAPRPGKLSASERRRKVKEVVAASGVDTQAYFDKVVTQSSNAVTFREQAALWLDLCLPKTLCDFSRVASGRMSM
jgi:hypothetical protein